MASGWTAAIVLVVGLVVSGVVYNSVANSTVEDITEVDVVDDTLTSSFVYAGNVGNYLWVAVSDGSRLISQLVYSSGDYTLEMASESITEFSYTVVQSDYTKFTITVNILDGEAHTLTFYFCMADSATSVSSDDYESWSSVEISSESGTATLLLTQSSFVAALYAAVVFVIFIVIALMLYAAGGRR